MLIAIKYPIYSGSLMEYKVSFSDVGLQTCDDNFLHSQGVYSLLPVLCCIQSIEMCSEFLCHVINLL